MCVHRPHSLFTLLLNIHNNWFVTNIEYFLYQAGNKAYCPWYNQNYYSFTIIVNYNSNYYCSSQIYVYHMNTRMFFLKSFCKIFAQEIINKYLPEMHIHSRPCHPFNWMHMIWSNSTEQKICCQIPTQLFLLTFILYGISFRSLPVTTSIHYRDNIW